MPTAGGALARRRHHLDELRADRQDGVHQAERGDAGIAERDLEAEHVVEVLQHDLEVLRDMKGSDNLVIFVPTEGGLPVLNLGEMRKNLRRP